MDLNRFPQEAGHELGPPQWRCDFCGHSPPVWVYPTRTHDVYEIELAAGPTITGQSTGGWLACHACQPFIDRIRDNNPADRERLARRCATLIARQLNLSQKAVLSDIRALQQGFFEHRLGDGRPWTEAEAQEAPPPPFEYREDKS